MKYPTEDEVVRIIQDVCRKLQQRAASGDVPTPDDSDHIMARAIIYHVRQINRTSSIQEIKFLTMSFAQEWMDKKIGAGLWACELNQNETFDRRWSAWTKERKSAFQDESTMSYAPNPLQAIEKTATLWINRETKDPAIDAVDKLIKASMETGRAFGEMHAETPSPDRVTTIQEQKLRILGLLGITD